VGGGSGGIGRAICRALAAGGWNIALTYNRRREPAQEIAEEITRAGGGAYAVQLDLTDADATSRAVDEVADHGELSGLVYAAGPVIAMDYVSNLTPGQFARILDIDLKGAINLLQPAIKHLRANTGTLVALSTQAVARYAKQDALSTVPKAAVEAFVRAIAVEEGRYGVTANVIGVGMLEGEGMWDTMHQTGAYTEPLLAAARAATPMRRFGRPEDVAALTRFLMSDQASWITGQTICVDGGYSV
jgi:NAD(P)-dependent dehydrogenase (short-subunit alcohol dehydrogenase family)